MLRKPATDEELIWIDRQIAERRPHGVIQPGINPFYLRLEDGKKFVRYTLSTDVALTLLSDFEGTWSTIECVLESRQGVPPTCTLYRRTGEFPQMTLQCAAYSNVYSDMALAVVGAWFKLWGEDLDTLLQGRLSAPKGV